MIGTINNGDVAFMVVSTVLVFLTTPGLAFFYGGLIEKKSALTMMIYTFLSIGIVIILWVLGGFSLVFGNDLGGLIGNPADYFMLTGMDSSINTSHGSEFSVLMFFMYQLMFAIIAAPLMTGAFANRMKIGGWLRVLILWMFLIYFPVAHWIWGGGFLSQWGFVDYAGGTVIHVTAGFAALASVFFLGKRAYPSKEFAGNVVWMAIGGSILLFGWFGFSSGGVLSGDEVTAIAFANTGIAIGFSAMVWVFLAYMRDRRFSLTEFMTGAIAGLVTITPCSGYINSQGAVIVGLLAPLICFFSLKLLQYMRMDDAVGVWGVHGMGGLNGSVITGVLAVYEVNNISAGVHQLSIQILGVVLVASYSFIITYLILKICDSVSSIRVPDAIQKEGLDIYYMKERIE